MLISKMNYIRCVRLFWEIPFQSKLSQVRLSGQDPWENMDFVWISCFSSVYQWNKPGELSDFCILKSWLAKGECTIVCYRLMRYWANLAPSSALCSVLCSFSRNGFSLCFMAMFLTAYRWCLAYFTIFSYPAVSDCMESSGISPLPPGQTVLLPDSS